MIEQFQAFLLFYRNPRRASNMVLDHGSFLFALIAAVLVTIGMSMTAEFTATAQQAKWMQEHPREARELAALMGRGALEGDDGASAPQAAQNPTAGLARAQGRAYADAQQVYSATGLKTLLAMAAVFIPIAVLMLAGWEHMGGGMTILFRDYMPALTACLFAWAAAKLPFALAGLVFMGSVHQDWFFMVESGLATAAMVTFVVLSSFALSTVTGATLGHSMVAAVVGQGACVCFGFLFGANTGLLYMFGSPWVLYYVYQMFGRDMRSLGGGLSARQNFRRQLEAAALNPRDPDPHYQLGLLYAHRRSYVEAEASFRRALEIQPKDAETLFQMGKMLRNQPGRSQEALGLLEQAVQIDPALANYEVWRELGALALEAGRADVAVPQLEHYVAYREYDPEGLVLLGQALRTANREPDAKAAFEKAIVAVRTAPSFRRHALKQWESQARQELKR